jgi:hypothetical protein
MKLTQINENVLQKLGRTLKIGTTKGKPNPSEKPDWANYLGKTPEGAYHWLSNKSVITNDTNNEYFPDANKTKFSGYMGDKSKNGSIEKI